MTDLRKLLDEATPGPWIFDDALGPVSEWGRSNLGVWSQFLLDASTAADDGDDPMDDAWVCGIWGELSDGDVANARLIALAPSLAAALLKAEEALERLSCLGNGDRPGNSDGNMIARAALSEIRKLTGEA